MTDEELKEQKSSIPEKIDNEKVSGVDESDKLQHQSSEEHFKMPESEVEPATGTIAQQQANEPTVASSSNPTQPLHQPQPPRQPETPVLQNKPKKKYIVGASIAAVLVLLVGGTALGYNLWFQNPQKVISDALVNALGAESVKTNGTLTLSDTTDTASLKATFSSTGNQERGAATADLRLKAEGETLALKGDVVYSENGDVYVKIKGVKNIINKFLTGIALPGSYADLINKVDDNWIMISAQKLKELNKDAGDTQECTTSILKKLRNDKVAMADIGNAYKDNQFILIKDKLGAKDGSIGYSLDIDESKSDTFGKELEKTKLFKDLEKCDKSGALKNSENSKDMQQPAKPSEEIDDNVRVELWVSRWSHEITGMSLTTDEKESVATFNLNPVFNTPVEVKTPVKSISIDVLKKEIEAIQQDIKQSFTLPSNDMTGAGPSVRSESLRRELKEQT